MKDSSDNELVVLARQGNEEAKKVLVERYQKSLDSMAKHIFYRSKDLRELEDAKQVANLEFLKCIDSYDPEKGIFRFYMRLVVKQRLIDYYQSCIDWNINVITTEDVSKFCLAEPEESYSVKTDFLNDAFLDGISWLKEDEKKLIRLKGAGYSYNEIAKLLNISTKKVDNMIYYIRLKAKKRGVS